MGKASGESKKAAKKPGAKPAKSSSAKAAKAGSSKAASSKADTTKTGTTKASAKKPSTKSAAKAASKAAKSPAARAPATKKPVSAAKAPAASAKAGGKSPGEKPAEKPSAKKAGSGAVGKVNPAEAPAAKPSKKPVEAPTAPPPGTGAVAGADDASKRKGITIVDKRSPRRPKRPQTVTELPKTEAPLLGPGLKRPRPLIPSGPKNDASRDGVSDAERLKKSPLGKKDTERYRQLLLSKRRELMGDVERLEHEALMGAPGESGGSSDHDGEDSTESYDRALTLDLAAADRRLIREIDEALARIEAGTYGICTMTGRPINPARLDELPWTPYSIVAARSLERGAPLA